MILPQDVHDDVQENLVVWNVNGDVAGFRSYSYPGRMELVEGVSQDPYRNFSTGYTQNFPNFCSENTNMSTSVQSMITQNFGIGCPFSQGHFGIQSFPQINMASSITTNLSNFGFQSMISQNVGMSLPGFRLGLQTMSPHYGSYPVCRASFQSNVPDDNPHLQGMSRMLSGQATNSRLQRGNGRTRQYTLYDISKPEFNLSDSWNDPSEYFATTVQNDINIPFPTGNNFVSLRTNMDTTFETDTNLQGRSQNFQEHCQNIQAQNFPEYSQNLQGCSQNLAGRAHDLLRDSQNLQVRFQTCPENRHNFSVSQSCTFFHGSFPQSSTNDVESPKSSQVVTLVSQEMDEDGTKFQKMGRKYRTLFIFDEK